MIKPAHTGAERLASAIARAEPYLAEFEFTRLVESESVEVWRCKKRNSGMYSHDITITSRGIAVVGDMDGLLFNVGSDYGMHFLAGDDIAYYMHSKLEAQCKEREFNRDGFLCFVAQELLYRTGDQLDLLPCLRALVPELGPTADAYAVLQKQRHDVEGEKGQVAIVEAIFMLADLDLEKGNGVFERYASDVRKYIDEARTVADGNSVQDALEFLRDNENKWVDLSDGPGHIDRVHEETLFRLCMVNGSAKRILAIKEQERAAQFEPIAPIEGFERDLLKGNQKIGGGDVLALYDLPATPQECFAAGWNRRTELNRVQAAVEAPQFRVVQEPATHNEPPDVVADRPRG